MFLDELAAMGRGAIMTTSTDALASIQDAFESNSSSIDAIRSFGNCKLLVIDDLGKEPACLYARLDCPLQLSTIYRQLKGAVMIRKSSVRYFNNTAIRAIWDKSEACWFYSAVDVISALTNSDNPRIYWNACKKRNPELNTFCRQLKLTASDGKQYLSDCVGQAGIDAIAVVLPGKYRAVFADWIAGKLSPLDEQSKRRAYELWESPVLDEGLVGTVEGLQQIHAFLFGGLYDFAGKIRTKNISKGGFQFANCQYFGDILARIESMPETSVAEIVEKYVEMNIAHPFMEGNGRAMRIWLDLLLKHRLGLCVDWRLIDKRDYLRAMERSVVDSTPIRALIEGALTDRIDDRELFMKGIDYSYYYEEIDD